MMNYFLPLKGIAAMHCSANCDMNGENTAIFFGLSGTGKTTLSTDPKRKLIGDDEHGWDDNGVFNFEGGCYAKVIKLDKESEPDIYNAIRRDALLENVTVDAEGKIDFNDKSVTENTRVSYPIYHIKNIVRPVSHAPAAKQVIFLSADAFGFCLQYLSSTSSRHSITSSLVSQLNWLVQSAVSLSLHLHSQLASARHSWSCTQQNMLRNWLSTWRRAVLRHTWLTLVGTEQASVSLSAIRGIIDAILNGSIDKAPTKTIPYFNFVVPTQLEGVATNILDPRDTYADASQWEEKAKDLAGRFIKNFAKYEGNAAGKALVAAGPKL